MYSGMRLKIMDRPWNRPLCRQSRRTSDGITTQPHFIHLRFQIQLKQRCNGTKFIHPLLFCISQAHQGGVRGDLQRGRPQVDESRRAGLRLVLVSSHDSIQAFPSFRPRCQSRHMQTTHQGAILLKGWMAVVVGQWSQLLCGSCPLLLAKNSPLIRGLVICITKRSWNPAQPMQTIRQVIPSHKKPGRKKF